MGPLEYDKSKRYRQYMLKLSSSTDPFGQLQHYISSSFCTAYLIQINMKWGMSEKMRLRSNGRWMGIPRVIGANPLPHDVTEVHSGNCSRAIIWYLHRFCHTFPTTYWVSVSEILTSGQ